jgi:RNA-directed DNA polymerase
MQGETRWSASLVAVMKTSVLLDVLASSLLAGEANVADAHSRLVRSLDRNWRWLRPLAARYVKAFGRRTRPHRREVHAFLRKDSGLLEARRRYREEIEIEHWLAEPQIMQPITVAATWNVPAIESVGALSEWLAVNPSELLWLADLKGLAAKMKAPRLQHYHYRVLRKSTGGFRLIEIPKPRLKDIQRQILFHILNKIPPHPAVHGFLRDRSIRTFVAPHVGRRVVLRMDLQDFFPTFGAARIATFFRIAGYPESVADLLAGLCTTTTPRSLWSNLAQGGEYNAAYAGRDLYSRPHLPQGAPTSPALANICTYRTDCRLAGLAKSAGAQYTRYADDLAFSGDKDFEKCVDRFSVHVAAVLIEEGFSVNHRKTRVMRRGVRQHLAGIVTNRSMNIVRRDFDRLKATLTNCIRHGANSQNHDAHPQFRSHLEGRVAYVEMINPAKGHRLRSLLDQVSWSSTNV